MARLTRDQPPTGNGPGRGTPRSRTVARPGQRASQRTGRRSSAHADEVPVDEVEEATRPHLSRGLGLTRRAIVLLVVGAMLLLSYVGSLRVYFRQQSQIAAVQAANAQRQASIDTLQDQVTRWKDPAYVREQARTRLGWVMPGEIGYQVIGADGTVLSPSVGIDGTSPAPAAPTGSWWVRLGGSISAADEPTPAATPAPSAPGTITVTTTPTATATPTP